MKDIRYFMENARHLSSHVITNWDNYDFKEKSKDVEKRVPAMRIAAIKDVEVVEKAMEHIHSLGYEKFIRNYEVTYKDAKYQFTITVSSYLGCVQMYELAVYLMNHQEKTRLFTERL